MRLLVCGGRGFSDRHFLFSKLDEFDKTRVVDILIHGACHLGGADALAHDWAMKHGVWVVAFPVMHHLDGPWPGAGPRRNERMLRDGRPNVVMAFKGGRGTADMMRQARAWGIEVIDCGG